MKLMAYSVVFLKVKYLIKRPLATIKYAFTLRSVAFNLYRNSGNVLFQLENKVLNGMEYTIP